MISSYIYNPATSCALNFRCSDQHDIMSLFFMFQTQQPLAHTSYSIWLTLCTLNLFPCASTCLIKKKKTATYYIIKPVNRFFILDIGVIYRFTDSMVFRISPFIQSTCLIKKKKATYYIIKPINGFFIPDIGVIYRLTDSMVFRISPFIQNNFQLAW